MKQPREPMSKSRLESFTDSVIAVIITVLVLNLHAPLVAGWGAWRTLFLPILIYAMGFQLTGAMWLLHHNTVVRITHLNRTMVWANFLFLLLLSLFPLTVQAVSLHPQDPADLAVFCINAICCGIALTIFRVAGLRDHADDPTFREWNKRRSRLAFVGLGSVLFAMFLGFYSTYIALAIIATTLVLVLLTG